MTNLKITIGDRVFPAKLEEELAPKTCAIFKKLLPFKSQVIHVRWSGEGVWVPLGETRWDGLEYENHTSFPSKGEILVYPGGISEMEIIMAYGNVQFASKVGQLAGNHFITVTDKLDEFYQMGRDVLYKGAMDLLIEEA